MQRVFNVEWVLYSTRRHPTLTWILYRRSHARSAAL